MVHIVAVPNVEECTSINSSLIELFFYIKTIYHFHCNTLRNTKENKLARKISRDCSQVMSYYISATVVPSKDLNGILQLQKQQHAEMEDRKEEQNSQE